MLLCVYALAAQPPYDHFPSAPLVPSYAVLMGSPHNSGRKHEMAAHSYIHPCWCSVVYPRHTRNTLLHRVLLFGQQAHYLPCAGV